MQAQLKQQAHDDLEDDITRELRGRRCMDCGGGLVGRVVRGEEYAECADCGAEEPLVVKARTTRSCKHDALYRRENEQHGGVGCPLCNRERKAQEREDAAHEDWLDEQATQAAVMPGLF